MDKMSIIDAVYSGLVIGLVVVGGMVGLGLISLKKNNFHQPTIDTIPAAVAIAIDTIGVSISIFDWNGEIKTIAEDVTVGGFMPTGQVYFHQNGELVVLSGPYLVNYHRTQIHP